MQITQDLLWENPLWGKTQPQIRTMPLSLCQIANTKEMVLSMEFPIILWKKRLLQNLISPLLFSSIHSLVLLLNYVTM